MTQFFALLLLFLRTVELRHVQVAHAASEVHQGSALETQFVRDADALPAGTEESDFRGNVRAPTNHFQSLRIIGKESDANPKRIPRGAKDGSSRKRDPHSLNSYRHPRPYGPDDYFTTPRSDRHTYRGVPGNSTSARGTVFVHNTLFPVTDGSYGAYAVMLLALVLFAAGIVGNLALMCIVWHNYYLKSAWNSILAGLAFWDFVVLFFCLPVVVFHELTAKRLLGDVSCRLVPYMEVTSLGVATFSLCALSIDRFHVATSSRSLQMPQVEPCQSILAKLSVIWVGSMVLAAPELLLWQLTQEAVTSSAIIKNGSLSSAPTGLQETQPGSSLAASFRGQTGVFLVDMCVRQPSLDLPENIYSLVMTYHEARMWWYFGCYFCLPLLFTLACNLLTRHVLAQHAPQKQGSSKVTGGHTSSSSSSNSSSSTKKKQHLKREQRLTSTVTALAILYAMCNLPENACNITLAYVSIPISPATEALLALIGQFLLYVRCSATPVLLLCLCRSLGQAFMDCCCCCCEECLTDSTSSSSSSASTTATTSSTSPSSLSSPTSPSPSSLSPSSSKEDNLKIVSGTTPAIYYDRAKDSSVVAIGTPC